MDRGHRIAAIVSVWKTWYFRSVLSPLSC